MADERGLQGLDPYDLVDIEADRLRRWFAGLDAEQLREPSGCEGWSRRDVLAHLLAIEEYHAACLAGTVSGLVASYVDQGAKGLDDFNAMGVARAADIGDDELLAAWVVANEANRAGLRAADGTDIDSTVGAYPARQQAFHIASELAVHADDVDAPVEPAEAAGRRHWLAGVSRFALTEVKPDAAVEVGPDDGYTVRLGGREVATDEATFVAAVSGRIAPGVLSPEDAELLWLGY